MISISPGVELNQSIALLGDLKETAETDVLIAVQELQKSESAVKIANGELNRAESLLKEGITTQQKFDEVFDRTKAALSDLEVKRTRYKIAQAHQRIAEAQYWSILAHERPRPVTSEYHAENIAVIVEAIQMSEAALQKAQLELLDTELRAPFGGVVGQLVPKVGEFVDAGSTILTIADLSQWQIETTDLTELSVVKLKNNDIAKISFDALPNVQMAGRITRIQPMGENKHGDILYTVVIKPDRIDPGFKWNMTAVVTMD
jgi:HlyD family secretion protein